MTTSDRLNSLYRKIIRQLNCTGIKVIRRLNWAGIYLERGNKPYPTVIVAGYTRSGTTFLGRILANILGCRPIHEPLNSNKVSEIDFFNERESVKLLRTDTHYRHALTGLFGPNFRGNKNTNTGTRLIYDGRLIKIVRGNHYLDYLAELFTEQKFIFIMRNPWACITSRLRLGWSAPDLSNCIDDIWPLLNPAQQDCFKSTTSKAGRLAITWCIDNMMALRNADNPSFYFVHYEELVLHPQETLEAMLKHIGQDYSATALKHEIRREGAGKQAKARLDSWLKHMDDNDKQAVTTVLKIFGMNDFYSESTALPVGMTPFKVIDN